MTQSSIIMMKLFIFAGLLHHNNHGISQNGRDSKGANLASLLRINAGAATIRCFNQEKLFLTKVKALIDDHSRVAFHNIGTMEWLSVRINFFFNLILRN